LAAFSAGCATKGGPKGSAPAPAPSAPAQPAHASVSDAEVERLVQAHAAYAAGLVAQENNADDAGLEYFAKSVAADPGNEQLALEVARRYLEREQGEKAVTVLKRAAAQPGSSGAAKSFLALTYYQLGRKDEALAAYREALKVLPASLANSQALAQLLAERKQPEEALKVLRDAGKQPVDNAAYRVDLALSFGRLGSREAKLRDKLKPDVLAALEKAAALKPDEPTLLQKMGESYEAFGRNSQGRGALQGTAGTFPRTGCRRPCWLTCT
jgi:Flp pilus assembly protein TadD